MTKLYDERRVREITPAPWAPEGDKTACDIFYLRCRLFRLDAEDTQDPLATRECWPVYLLLEEYKSYEGDPVGTARELKEHTNKRVFLTGPDSKRIRQTITILDAFSDKVDCDSN